MSDQTAEQAPQTMTLDEVNRLVDDDVAYWLNNPFMPPDLIAEKVCWWVSRAAQANIAPDTARVLSDVASERERQVRKGWTREHDDTHHTPTLVRLAVGRTNRGSMTPRGHSREGLIEAAAMLVAAVEAMDRASNPPEAPTSPTTTEEQP